MNSIKYVLEKKFRKDNSKVIKKKGKTDFLETRQGARRISYSYHLYNLITQMSSFPFVYLFLSNLNVTTTKPT